MKESIYILLLLIAVLLGTIVGYTSKNNDCITTQIKTSYLNNKIIQSNYNINTNMYSVIYIENNDTLALDYIYPIELDSLINDLNNQ